MIGGESPGMTHLAAVPDKALNNFMGYESRRKE